MFLSRWSAIARHLPKRTDNEIKNYWNTHLKKRLVDMGNDPVTHNQISPSPTSSSSVDNPGSVGEQRSDSQIKPIQRSISTSTKLINKVSAKFAQMQRKEIATKVLTSSPSLDAIKAVLLNSTKDTITFRGCTRRDDGGSGGDGDDIDVEIIASRPVSCSSSSRILNKMATKLKPSKNLDLLKDRLSVPSKQSMASTSTGSDTSAAGGSYNNIESPISISDFLESLPTSSSACESSEFTGNLNMGDDQVNEALAALHQAMELETTTTPESPMYTPYELEEFLENYGGDGEDHGATFTNDVNQSKACDSQVATSMEPTTDFIQQFTNMPFDCRDNEYSTTKCYFYGEEESNGGDLEVNMNYWNEDYGW